MSMDKVIIRKQVRNQLNQIPGSIRAQWNIGLQKNVVQFLQNFSGMWGAYMPLKEEPVLENIWELCPQIQWCFPRVVSGVALEYLKVSNSEHWSEGSLKGLLEPDPQYHSVVSLDQIEGCIVPALAFDKRGYRLGRGRGYYDRAFENYNGIKVGIAYSAQILEMPLPNEPHDICMDYLLTEEKLIQIHRKD